MRNNNLSAPTNVAIVQNEDVVSFPDAFRNVLRKAEGKKIVCVQFLGGYQQGKSSTISYITGNTKNHIGDGINEETRGIWVDGPYTIQEIAQRFNIAGYSDRPDDNAIFFIDCEGSGGFDAGQTQIANQLIMQKLDIPFISISSCVVYLANRNESKASVENLASVLKFKAFASNINDIIKDSLSVLALFKNIPKFKTVDYSMPNPQNYLQISKGLENHWNDKLPDIEYEFYPRPLPIFDDRKSIFDQDANFKNGFRLVVQELVGIISNSLDSYLIHDAEGIYQLYSRACQVLSEANFSELIMKAKEDASNSTFRRIAETFRNQVMEIVTADIDQFMSQQRIQGMMINLDAINDLRKECLQYVDEYFDEKFSNGFRELGVIEEQVIKAHEDISQKIDTMTKQLIIELSPKILNNFVDQLNNFTDRKITEFNNLISTPEKFKQFIPNKQDYIQNIKNELKDFAENVLRQSADNVDAIWQQANTQTELISERIVTTIDSIIQSQEQRFTITKQEFKNEPDPNEKSVVVFYMRENKIYPDGHQEQGEWREIRRERKLHVASTREETKSEIQGDNVVVYKRTIKEKEDGTTETGSWEQFAVHPGKVIEKTIEIRQSPSRGGFCNIF